MTARTAEIFFDTWAWWEILNNTVRGRRLHARYVAPPAALVHTSVLTLAEIIAKAMSRGGGDRATKAVALIESKSRVHGVSRDVAVRAGPLREELRTRDRRAGIVDAVILATARSVGATVISGDPAMEPQPDVRDH